MRERKATRGFLAAYCIVLYLWSEDRQVPTAPQGADAQTAAAPLQEMKGKIVIAKGNIITYRVYACTLEWESNTG
jgi:hypothetical protein